MLVNFVIRKLKLLQLVYDYSDSQLILEIMTAAPQYWHSIIKTDFCVYVDNFINAVKYNEDTLIDTDSDIPSGLDLDLHLQELEAEIAALEIEDNDSSS